MKGLAFDVKGKLAHFRRPDTTATQLTYPFITPTAAKGIVGAILGITDFVTQDKVGIELLCPIKIVSQQMSMLGKDNSTSFNRPTTIELIINPAYRIYYAGDEYTERLLVYLKNERSVYSTYLGAAYALTKPVFYKQYDNVQSIDYFKDVVESITVVPTAVIERIIIKDSSYFCRAGGYMHSYNGTRTFEKSIDFIYEKEGKAISFIPRNEDLLGIEVKKFGDDWICLV